MRGKLRKLIHCPLHCGNKYELAHTRGNSMVVARAYGLKKKDMPIDCNENSVKN